MTLVRQNAAITIADRDAKKQLTEAANRRLQNTDQIELIGMAAHALARPDATKSIVNQVIEIARR